MHSAMRMSGRLKTVIVKEVPLSWKVRNVLRPSYLWGYFTSRAARIFSKMTGIPTLVGKVSVRLFHGEKVIDYGIVSWRVVTDAFVEFMVDELQAETVEWGDFQFHDCGTGVVAENAADVGLGIPYGGARNAGTQVEGAAANIYRSVGTITPGGVFAITEHGLFNNAAGITLMDRTVFAAINVVAADSIEFTYELTCNSGG